MSSASPRSSLPHQLTSFIGRESELGELRALLRDARLVSVAGGAGMGKTRIALEVGARLVEDLPGGVHFVPLGTLASGALVAQAVAAALGVREQPARPPLESLVDEIGPGPALLLLDGCEHLLDSAARVAESLLRGCPGLTVLATSREPLRVPGEVVWRIAPMAVPDAWDPRPPAEFESVRLFAERAALARPRFALDEEGARVVAQICRRLDGIPLAIELAAARAEMMSVEDILERLEDRFRLLTGGSRTAMPRHQTLHAALDWGHQLLEDPERRLFRRLSVFKGGFDLAAAEAVCGGPELNADELVTHLSRLVDKSFTSPEPRGSGPTRYRMLETVRQYAAERLLESGEAERVRFRHADHFLALAEQAQRFELSASQPVWTARLEAEHENLRAALEWCRAHEAARWLRLAVALGWFWVTRGRLAEGREYLTGAVGMGALDPADRAHGLLWLARVEFWEGDYDGALAHCEQSLALYRELGDEFNAGWPLNLIGSIRMYQGRLLEARELLERLIAETENPDARIEALTTLGETLMQAGELGEARRRLDESQALAGAADARSRAAVAVMLLGILDYFGGDLDPARERLLESLDVFHRFGNRYAFAAGLNVMAGLALAASQPERALRLCAAAAALREQMLAPLAPSWERVITGVVVEPARREVGAQAEVVWAEGARMTPDAALAYAQAAPGQEAETIPAALPEPLTGDGRGRPGGLSRRELEVALMVAQGMTNRQVADRLVLAERTVEGHVERVRGKLGVHSRTQIAVWVVEQGLAAEPADGG